MKLTNLLGIILRCTQVHLTIQAATSKSTSLSSKSKPSLAPQAAITKNRHVQVGQVSSSGLSLWDLIAQKPERLDHKDGKEFMIRFANHPSIKAINTNNPETSEAVHQFIRLSAGSNDRKEKQSLHALINRHLEQTGARPELIAMYKGQRFRLNKQLTNRNARSAKKAIDPVRFARDSRKAINLAKARALEREPAKELSDFLDGSIKNPKKMSAINIAERARLYRGEYESEIFYTLALKRYLKDHKFSKDEINAATGWTAFQVKNEKVRKFPERATGLLGSGVSSRDMKWLPDVSSNKVAGRTQQQKKAWTEPSWTKVPRRARTEVIFYPTEVSPSASTLDENAKKEQSPPPARPEIPDLNL